MRTLGIEEELLVVDTESGRPLSVAERILRRVPQSEDVPGGTVDSEMQRQQLEIDTPPRSDLAELDEDLRRWRDVAGAAARKMAGRVVAVGTSPMPVEPQPIHDQRYLRMLDRYGLTGEEHLTCGCHVHVSVDSEDEGVAVLDRIRVWLPSLLAISANSPFWQGRDTRYASFRSQAVARWPSAGPTELFGSARAYRQLVADMVETGVLLDSAMVAFDARLSERYPTVEIRVADVCLDAHDAVLVAGLCRGLVETAAEDWVSERPCPAVPTTMLRLATWQAGREGVDGTLLDPLTARPRPASDVLSDLLEHVRPALTTSGDIALVEERLGQVMTRGNGARRQRAALEKTSRLVDVVADLARATAGHDG
jgi:glutamate---cysteine ligase / carboxylate-amine ligase